MTDRQKAIVAAEEARKIHKWWVDNAHRLSARDLKIGGNVVHHRKWVRNYDLIIRVLRGKRRRRCASSANR